MTQDDSATTTLNDEEIETRTGAAATVPAPAADTGDDTGDTGDVSDTGDDSGDPGDVSDTGDDSGDTGDAADTGA